MEIPLEQLNAATVDGLIEEFVTRDGTDYGAEEVELAQKKADVARLLRSGEVVIVFDPASETSSIVTREALQQTRG